MVTVALVAVCAGLAAVTRFLVDGLLQSQRDTEFPLGTLAVNLSGCFLLGLLSGVDPNTKETLILGTATIGSYTTFSTWMLESHRPAEDGEGGLALGNLAIGLAAGLAAVALGRALGGAL
jgi:CrcB protein